MLRKVLLAFCVFTLACFVAVKDSLSEEKIFIKLEAKEKDKKVHVIYPKNVKNDINSPNSILLSPGVVLLLEADAECILRAFPSDKEILKWVKVRGSKDKDNSSEVILFGKFVPNAKEFTIVRSTAPYIYAILALKNGSCELLVVPVGGNDDSVKIFPIVVKDVNPEPEPIPPAPEPKPVPEPENKNKDLDKQLVEDLKVALAKDVQTKGLIENNHCQLLGQVYTEGSQWLIGKDKTTIGEMYSYLFDISVKLNVPRRDQALINVRKVIDQWVDKKFTNIVGQNWHSDTVLESEKIQETAKILKVLGNSLVAATQK